MNAPKAGAATCVGCHVLSRDGDRISLGLDIPAPSPYKVFDVASQSLVYGSQAGGTPGANFFTFSPDKKQIMISNGVTLSLRDAATGAAVVDNAGQGAMPDWSPDGTRIVFAKPKVSPPCFGAICGSPGVSEASLYTIAGSGTGPASVLVPSTGQNNYYPSYSPDGAWVAFNRASVGTDAAGEAKSSYDAPDATVWAVSAAGGAPVALSRATSDRGDSWPKWMQGEQAYRGKKLMWLTFSSRRAYGLRVAPGTTAQIWMVAFDPEAAKAGKDPAFAAFWLPFQETSSGNHIAQWVTKVARKGCTESTQCEGTEACIDSVCKPTLK
jgi:TolB protein